MNDTSARQIAPLDSPNLTPSTPVKNAQPQQPFLKKWQLVPVMVMPLLVVASSYFTALQASQTQQVVTKGLNETQQAVALSYREFEQSQTEREAERQKYYAALARLQEAQAEQRGLDKAYQDALVRMDTLVRQNQQLKQRSADWEALKTQAKQLQESNGNLKKQVQQQREQLTTLQNRLKTVENQRQQLTKENQQLRLAKAELEPLKPELAQAKRTIEQLNARISSQPSQTATIKVNGQQFSVTPELATALNAERQQVPGSEEHSSTAQQSSVALGN